MLIFWIILIWSLITSLLFSIICKKKKCSSKTKFVFLMITFLAMIFFASHRSVVSDTMAYTNFFNQMPSDIESIPNYIENMKKDTLFWLLSALFKCTISDNYHVWFAFITIICSMLIARFIVKYSKMPFLSGFMFILNCDFCWFFNGMRQFIAVCIMLYAFECLIKNKKLKFFITSIFATFIHFSALIIIPIFLIAKKANNYKKMVVVYILFIVFILSLNHILPNLEMLLARTEYRNVISQFSSDDGVNIIRVLISLVPVVLYYIFKKNDITNENNNIKVIVNICLMNSLILIVGVLTSGIYVGRFSIYCDLFTLILYPYIFATLLKPRTKLLFIICYVIMYFLYFYYQMVITWKGFGYVSDSLGIYLR